MYRKYNPQIHILAPENAKLVSVPETENNQPSFRRASPSLEERIQVSGKKRKCKNNREREKWGRLLTKVKIGGEKAIEGRVEGRREWRFM
jgi:hypothetical protein